MTKGRREICGVSRESASDVVWLFVVLALAWVVSVPIAAEELEDLIDRVVGESIETVPTPGALVSIVQGGEVVLNKGYGLADVESQQPMSADSSVVRVASLSKLVTTVAALQLVERGEIDLQKDVNAYLSEFNVESAFDQPITLSHLLTHTAGFDVLYLGTASRDEAGQIPLGQYLAEEMPARIFPPGKVVSYSNHGLMLAGYLVEKISGMAFEDYVQRQVFMPLGMSDSTFHHTAKLEGRLATGYARGEPVPYDYLNTLPAAGLLTTGADMGDFMLAVLRASRGEEETILGQEMAEAMLRRQFSHHPRLAGRTYGWFERFDQGRQILGHTGEVRGFASSMYLVPAANVGLFVATNENTPALQDAVLRFLLDEYIPEGPTSIGSALANPVTELEPLAGIYREVRYPHSSLDKLAILAGLVEEIEVAPAGPGRLLVQFTGGPPVAVVEVEPGLFQRETAIDLTNGRGLAFLEDSLSGGRFAFVGEFAYEKLAWYESAKVQEALILGLTLVFLAALLGARWRRQVRFGTSAKWTAGLEAAIGLLNLILLVGLGIVLAGTEAYEFSYGVPASVRLLLLIPWLSVPLSVVLLVIAPFSWRSGVPFRWRLFDASTMLAGSLLLPVLLDYWNLIGAGI